MQTGSLKVNESQDCLIKLEENVEWRSVMRHVAGSKEGGRRKGFWIVSLLPYPYTQTHAK